MVKNTEKTRAAALKIYKDNELTIQNLRCRWFEEGQFEDFNDYRHGLKIKDENFVKMTKRPFGFKFKVADSVYQMSCNDRHISYKRIG